MVHIITAILSFLLATGLYGVGAFFCLVPTQGMKGNEGFFPVFLGYSIAFLIVNFVGAGIGLIPLGAVYGTDAWRHGLLGFMAGSVLAALGVAISLEVIVPAEHGDNVFPFGFVLSFVFPVSLLIPPIGGVLALARLRKKQRRA